MLMFITFVAICLSNLQLKELSVCHLFDEINIAEKHVFLSDNNIFSFDCRYIGDILIFLQKKRLDKKCSQ